jgi:hypothetical protein
LLVAAQQLLPIFPRPYTPQQCLPCINFFRIVDCTSSVQLEMSKVRLRLCKKTKKVEEERSRKRGGARAGQRRARKK